MELWRNHTTTLLFLTPFIILSHLHAQLSPSHNHNLTLKNEIPVGVILDLGSRVGKTVLSCITMSISDFYELNSHYKTRLILHTKDSKGEPLRALSAALDLLENNKMQAIIGLETWIEAKFLALLGDKAKVPVLSFTASPPSSTQHPYVVQIVQDETAQFRGIATFVESFKWRDVIIIYEDTDHGREILPFLAESFQEKNINIAYTSAISSSASDHQILEELHESKILKKTIFIVHVSPSLASRLFLNVKRLGMMSEGYAWIVTEETMNHLYSMDSEVIKSMHGVLGFKSYIPSSSQLHNVSTRWKNELYTKDPKVEVKDLNVLGILGYDAIRALAMAVERVGFESEPAKYIDTGLSSVDLANINASQNGRTLLNEIFQIRFKGLGGEFQIVDGKLISKPFEIVNVIGKGERRVGFWTSKHGITRELHLSIKTLDAIIWPGESTDIPKGWMIPMSGKKLRVGVSSNPGFKELVYMDRNSQTNETTFTGFCVDVFKAAIETLPFEVAYEFFPVVDANDQGIGTYNDLTYEVYLQKYDAVVGDITITANRSLYVDFTLPYTDLGVGMIARKPIDNKNMWIFLKPLDADLWLTSAAFFILTGFVVWVIEHPINEEFRGSVAHQIGTVFSFSFSTLVFAHRENLFSSLSKCVVVIWLFVVFILTSSYTATLSSLLTVQQIQSASRSDYIGYQYGSFVQGAITNNLNYQDNRLQPYSSPAEYADAMSKGSNSGGVAAIIDEIPYIKVFLAKYSADFSMIASETTTNGFGFVFQKGSPLVPEISRSIAKLRSERKLLMMENSWFNRASTFMPQTSVTTEPNILNLDRFCGLFIITAVTSCLALLVYSIYLLTKKFHVKNHITRILSQGRVVFIVKYPFIRNVNNIIEESNAI